MSTFSTSTTTQPYKPLSQFYCMAIEITYQFIMMRVYSGKSCSRSDGKIHIFIVELSSNFLKLSGKMPCSRNKNLHRFISGFLKLIEMVAHSKTSGNAMGLVDGGEIVLSMASGSDARYQIPNIPSWEPQAEKNVLLSAALAFWGGALAGAQYDGTASKCVDVKAYGRALAKILRIERIL